MDATQIYGLNTGGTLGMVGRPLRPAKSVKELLSGVPTPKSVKLSLADFPDREDSTNISHAQRIEMARMIAATYDEHDSFMIMHGTDSQAETCAVLSMVFKRTLQKSIFLVGGQNAKDEVGSEVRLQLGNTMRICRAFHMIGKVGIYAVCMSDVWDGSRLRKQKERDLAYIDTPGRQAIAKCWPEVTLLEGGRDFDPVLDVDGLRIDDHFERRVFSSIEVRRDSDPSALTTLVDTKRYKGFILVCKGAGQLPDKPWCDADGSTTLSWVEAVRYATSKGVVVGVISPFQDGEVLFDRYDLGKQVKEAGAISLETLTPDMGDAKFRNGLALYPNDPERLQKFISTNIVGELLPRRAFQEV